ncbi:MAG: hypothetical protein M1817_003061 [Caeruleum heppii]|nr:MAG: hypothetical protein M1817_003061 [Caeruleum heppii]
MSLSSLTVSNPSTSSSLRANLRARADTGRTSRVTFSDEREEHSPDEATQDTSFVSFDAIEDPPRRPRSVNSVRSRQSRCSSIISTRTKDSARSMEDDHLDGFNVDSTNGTIYNFGINGDINLVRSHNHGVQEAGGGFSETLHDVHTYYTEPFPTLQYSRFDVPALTDGQSTYPNFLSDDDATTRRSESPSPSYHSRLESAAQQDQALADEPSNGTARSSHHADVKPPSTPRTRTDVNAQMVRNEDGAVTRSTDSTPCGATIFDHWPLQPDPPVGRKGSASLVEPELNRVRDERPKYTRILGGDEVQDWYETFKAQQTLRQQSASSRAPGPSRPRIHAKAASDDSGIELVDEDGSKAVLGRWSPAVVEEAVVGAVPPPPMDTDNDISIHYTRLVRSIDMSHRAELLAKDDEIRQGREEIEALRREASHLRSEVLRTKNQVKAVADPTHVSRRLESTSGEAQSFSFPPLALNHVRTLKVALKRRATKIRRSIEDELSQSSRAHVADLSVQTEAPLKVVAPGSPGSLTSGEEARAKVADTVPKERYEEMAAALDLAQLEGRVAKSEIDWLHSQVSDLQESVGFWVTRSRTLSRQQQQSTNAVTQAVHSDAAGAEMSALSRVSTEERMTELAQRVRRIEDAAQYSQEIASHSRLLAGQARQERLRRATDGVRTQTLQQETLRRQVLQAPRPG